MSYIGSSEAITMALDIEKIERVMLNLLSNAIKFKGRRHLCYFRPVGRQGVYLREGYGYRDTQG